MTKSSLSIWQYVVTVKSMVKISSIFVAFLENMNFILDYKLCTLYSSSFSIVVGSSSLFADSCNISNIWAPQLGICCALMNSVHSIWEVARQHISRQTYDFCCCYITKVLESTSYHERFSLSGWELCLNGYFVHDLILLCLFVAFILVMFMKQNKTPKLMHQL